MLTITLKAFFHHGEEQIATCFENNAVLNGCIKKIKGIKRSKTNNCWYLPLYKENYLVLVEAVGDSAVIDSTAFKTYLEKRKK